VIEVTVLAVFGGAPLPVALAGLAGFVLGVISLAWREHAAPVRSRVTVLTGDVTLDASSLRRSVDVAAAAASRVFLLT